MSSNDSSDDCNKYLAINIKNLLFSDIDYTFEKQDDGPDCKSIIYNTITIILLYIYINGRQTKKN